MVWGETPGWNSGNYERGACDLLALNPLHLNHPRLNIDCILIGSLEVLMREPMHSSDVDQ